MNIIDCFMYFDEDMLLDIRLNILDKFVSKFVICEACFNHNGTSKKINFDINKFKKFQEKIIFLPLNEEPKNLKKFNNQDTNDKNSMILDNALIRENFQRNYLSKALKECSENDLIIISDIDEIPNLKNFKYEKKITIFKHKMFYYKFNLQYPNFLWTGSKICKKKDLVSPQWLRNIKSKTYPLWRLDILFSDTKYNDVKIIEDNGGWHFTNIKSAEKIDHKMKNFLHHLEYDLSGIKKENIQKFINEKRVLYDYQADQKLDKWKSEVKLQKVELKDLPSYINKNSDKFKDWID